MVLVGTLWLDKDGFRQIGTEVGKETKNSRPSQFDSLVDGLEQHAIMRLDNEGQCNGNARYETALSTSIPSVWQAGQVCCGE